jgi:rod shape-determining protein MreC
VRFGLQTVTYPLQLAVSSPAAGWGWVRESMRTRETLREENTELRTRLRDLELRTMRYEALSQENANIRGLRGALPPVAEKWLIAEIVHVELDSKRPSRVLINRGANNGVFKGQAVMDDEGILGQTTHVGPWSAEVILINDPEHEIPVQIERTGVRTIAQGVDDASVALGLPYLSANADIRVGDVLLTSGLGGVFPQGYPVAKVTALNRDAIQASERVRAEPLARVDRSREVMLVWFRDGHPAAPVPDTLTDLKKGDPGVSAKAVPPKPKTPPSAAAAPAANAATAPAKAPAGGAGPRQTVPTPTPARTSAAAPAPTAPPPAAPARNGAAPASAASQPATSAPPSRPPTTPAAENPQ